jgi:aspartyl-tRNA(Asn)/glutamyl-tRNA(Gln) amidotransferase subunit A
MSTSLADLGLREAARLVARRKVSPVELVDAALERIAELNPTLNAFITVTADAAREAAARAERRMAKRGSTSPLLPGLPISVKDLILTQDAPTTCGSRIFGDGLPAGRDAPVVAHLRRAGAAIIGKNNLHEIALGVTTVNEHFGPARNPHDPTRVSGGSSGGSAVAVAAGMGLGSVGSDTRGSIRIPSAWCGTVGLKPTYGLVPVDDVLPLAPSLDHLGPMTRRVEDAALLLGAMVGRRALADRLLRSVDRKPRRMTVGVAEFFLRDADPEIVVAVERAVADLAKMGHTIVAVELPVLEPAHEASRVIVLAEAIAFHDRFVKENRAGYGPMVLERLEGGYPLTALQYVKAEEVRASLLEAYTGMFREIDCLVGATLPLVAPPIGTTTVPFGDREVSLAEACCTYTAPQNMTGVPALSLPCGATRAGLPIGLQLIAGPGREDVVLALGAALERR